MLVMHLQQPRRHFPLSEVSPSYSVQPIANLPHFLRHLVSITVRHVHKQPLVLCCDVSRYLEHEVGMSVMVPHPFQKSLNAIPK